MSSSFSCVNCRLSYSEQSDYKLHYKSQHHRYNVKRRLIGLTPLSYQEYSLQFQNQCSSKSSTQKQLHCQLCSKKFLSPQTYKQHLNSQKHKNNRKKLLQNSIKVSNDDSRSQRSSCSQFSIIGDQKQKKNLCLFCSSTYSKQHMKKVHNFPPFSDQCINIEELTIFVHEEIKSGNCLICEQTFTCEQSAKQHMIDSGHAQLNINDFSKYQKFYLWKIQQSSQEQTQDQFQNLNNSEKQNKELDQSHDFEDIKKDTLQSLERKRLERITMTNIGYMINGKQVGARSLKQYYKQYLTRDIPENPYRQQQQALTNGQHWKNHNVKKSILPCRYQKIQGPIVNHR